MEPLVDLEAAPPTTVLRPWRELAVLAFIVMELSWVSLYCSLLLPAGRGIPYGRLLFALVGMLLITYWFSRWIDILHVRMKLRWVLLAGLFLLDEGVGLEALLGSPRFAAFSLLGFMNQPASTVKNFFNLVPSELIVLLIVFWIWWRGLALASKRIGPSAVIFGFSTGIVGFFIYGLVLPLTGRPPGSLPLFLFLLAGPLAMSAARVSVLANLRGGQGIPFSRYWLAGILAVVVLLAGLSALAADLLSGRGFSALYLIYSWVIYLLTLLLSPLLLLFMRLIFMLGGWIDLTGVFYSISDLLQRVDRMVQGLIDTLSRLFGQVSLPGLQRAFAALYSLRYVFLWIGILAVIWLVVVTLPRQFSKDEQDGEQKTESLLDGSLLASLLRAALRRGLAKVAGGLDNALRLRRAGRLLAAARIRRIYARLLALSAQLGRSRPAASTPLEFLPSLEDLFPGLAPELSTITHAYLRVRYGELSETRQEAEQVEEAWERVQAEGRARVNAQKRKR